MTDKTQGVEEKLVSMLDALEKGAVHVGDAVVKYSPDVAEATLLVVRIDGVQNIVTGLICAVLAFLSAKACVKWLKASDGDDVYIPLIASALITALVTTQVDFFNLIDVWNWVAIFEPKLYLAKQIIKAALGA